MYATFGDDRLKGMGVARDQISGFIDLRRRPYDTLALPCECVLGPVSPLFILPPVLISDICYVINF